MPLVCPAIWLCLSVIPALLFPLRCIVRLSRLLLVLLFAWLCLLAAACDSTAASGAAVLPTIAELPTLLPSSTPPPATLVPATTAAPPTASPTAPPEGDGTDTRLAAAERTAAAITPERTLPAAPPALAPGIAPGGPTPTPAASATLAPVVPTPDGAGAPAATATSGIVIISTTVSDGGGLPAATDPAAAPTSDGAAPTAFPTAPPPANLPPGSIPLGAPGSIGIGELRVLQMRRPGDSLMQELAGTVPAVPAGQVWVALELLLICGGADNCTPAESAFLLTGSGSSDYAPAPTFNIDPRFAPDAWLGSQTWGYLGFIVPQNATGLWLRVVLNGQTYNFALE